MPHVLRYCPHHRGGARMRSPWFWVLLAATVAVRVPFLLLPGHGYDLMLFREWAAAGTTHGPAAAVLIPDMNYVGYEYVLALVGWLYAWVAHPVVLATDPGLL